MRRQGTTTVEIKSGYGLTVHDEARSLAVARQFTEETTFLGAHVVPRGRRRPAEEYVALVTGPMLEACAPHARWIDAFCETGRVRRRPGRAPCSRPGLRRVCAAGCTRTSSVPDPGVRLACELGLAAVDHCTYLTDADVTALADSGTIATLLPGRRVLDPAALSRRAPAARRRRRGRARDRLQPRLVLHLLDAAVHRARRARDGDDARRGAHGRDARWRAGARPRRRRPALAGRTGRPDACSTRRRTSTSPTGPAYPWSPPLGWRAAP